MFNVILILVIYVQFDFFFMTTSKLLMIKCTMLNKLFDFFLCALSSTMYTLSHHHLQSSDTSETLSIIVNHYVPPLHNVADTPSLSKMRTTQHLSITCNVNLHRKFKLSHCENQLTSHFHTPPQSCSSNHLVNNNETPTYTYWPCIVQGSPKSWNPKSFRTTDLHAQISQGRFTISDLHCSHGGWFTMNLCLEEVRLGFYMEEIYGGDTMDIGLLTVLVRFGSGWVSDSQ